MKLPEGFKLDTEDQEEENIALPAGFSLDKPEASVATPAALPQGFTMDETPEEPPRSSFIGQISKQAGDVFKMFETEQQTFSPEIMAQAKKELAEKGAPPPILTAAADTILFGNFAEATAALESLFGDEPYEKRKQVREAMRQLRQEQAPVQVLFGTLLGFMAPAGAISTAGKLAKGAKLGRRGQQAAQAAAGTLQSAAIEMEQAKEGKELEAAAKSVAFDALTVGVLSGIGAVAKGAGKKAGKSVMSKLDNTDLSPADRKALADQVAEETQKRVDALNTELGQVKDLDEKTLKEIVNLKLAPDVEEVSEGALDAYKTLKAQEGALKEIMGPQTPSAVRDSIMKFHDLQYVGNYLDRRYGTTIAPDLNKVSNASNRVTIHVNPLRRGFQKIVDELTTNFKDIYEEILQANRAKDPRSIKLSEDAQRVVDYFETQMRPAANRAAEEAGLGSDYIKQLSRGRYYLPHKVKDFPALVETLESTVRGAVGKSIDKITKEDAKALMGDRRFMEAIDYLAGEKVNDHNKVLSILRNPQATKTAVELRTPVAAFRRMQEEVPELIREDDVARLASKWMNSTFANLLMRNPLAKIRAHAKSLKGIDDSMANYLDDYVSDQLGMRRGPSGGMSKLAEDWKTAMYRQAGKTGNSMYRHAGDLPEDLSGLLMNMYPYFLGLRVDAVVRNSTQPLQQTATSIGSALKGDGLAEVGKSMFSSYIDLAAKGGRDFNVFKKRLEAKGWLPDDPTPQDWQALSRGIRQTNPAAAKLKKVKNILDQKAMYFYQQGDVLNRIVTLKTADSLTGQVIKGTPRAERFMKGVPPGYQRKILKAKQAGDLQEVNDLIAEYLLAHTQFNYNRASMSEFGRWAGGAFTMFTKWPTAILGDVIDTGMAARYGQTTGGEAVRQIGRKYMAPFIMLAAADQLYQDEVEENPRLREILGSNLTSYASATSLTPFIQASIIQPPVLDIIQDPKKVISVVPGATYFKFVDERLPRWMNEDEKLITGE